MTDPVDTGFEDVIAGNVWKDPAEQIAATAEKLFQTLKTDTASASPVKNNSNPTSTPPTPVSSKPRFDSVSAPISEMPQRAAQAVTAPVTLSPAAVQAAKSLVGLPPKLDYVELTKLAREIAMDIKERHVILREYGLTQTHYDFLDTHNEFFRAALAAACAEWHSPMSTPERLRVEAAAILEDSLPGLGARMQTKAEGLPGVIEAAKLFAKIAGVGERAVSDQIAGERFTINIDLGGDQKISVSTAPGTKPSAASVEAGALHDVPPAPRIHPPVPKD